MLGLGLTHVSKRCPRFLVSQPSCCRYKWVKEIIREWFMARRICRRSNMTNIRPDVSGPSLVWMTSFRWRHNDRDGVSNYQSYDCLFNRSFRRSSKKTSKLRVAFVRGIHRWPVNSPHWRPVTRNMFPFDDVIILLSRKTPFPNRGNLNQQSVYETGNNWGDVITHLCTNLMMYIYSEVFFIKLKMSHMPPF